MVYPEAVRYDMNLHPLESMLIYLEESGRVDFATIMTALSEAQRKGGARMESVLLELGRKWNPHAVEAAKQEGMAEVVTTLLEYQLGKLTPTTMKRIQSLTAGSLKRLSTELLAFQTRDDLNKWLRQQPKNKEQQN